MTKACEYILSKFPDHRAKIIDLYIENEDFKILCFDYLNIAQSLEECRQSSMKDREIEVEFSNLFVELEKEITHLLSQKEA